MVKEFKLQDPGEGIHEVEIQEVLVDPGDSVEEGQTVMVIESDKAAIELPAAYTGTVAEIKVGAGDIVKVGAVLMTFDEAAAGKAAEKKEPGTDETRIEKPEKPNAKGPKAKGPNAKGPEQPEAKDGPALATPAVRRIARELGVDLHAVAPSGPEGRVTEEDVRASASQGGAVSSPARGAVSSAARGAVVAEEGEALPDFERWGEIERMPLRSIRRATARRMAKSWANIPHVTHQDKADITELERLRRRHKDEVEEAGGQLTLLPFVLKAVATALKHHPRFNASLNADADEIVIKRYCHLGVAVDTDRGLMVPVLRDVDDKSILDLTLELTRLAERARAGDISREEMAGGTFTVTNIGVLGGSVFTPIINYPEAAILGVGRARLELVVRGDLDEYEIEPRLMLPLCLAFDHRVNDGADAARFAGDIITMLSDPEELALMV